MGLLIQLVLIYLLVCAAIAVPIGIYRAHKARNAKFNAAKNSGHRQTLCTCGKYGCSVCDGGLFICAVCNCAEGTLTTHCPGAQVPGKVQDSIFAGSLDYVNGRWLIISPPATKRD